MAAGRQAGRQLLDTYIHMEAMQWCRIKARKGSHHQPFLLLHVTTHTWLQRQVGEVRHTHTHKEDELREHSRTIGYERAAQLLSHTSTQAAWIPRDSHSLSKCQETGPRWGKA